MPWSYRGLGVESEWRKSGFREAQKAGRRKGDVGEVADTITRRKIEIFMECSDDESAMAKKADGLDFEHVAVVGHKC